MLSYCRASCKKREAAERAAERVAVEQRAARAVERLLLAAEHGHEGVVAKLLAAGASVDITDRYEQTALHLAAEHGHEGVVAKLLAAGASVTRLTGVWHFISPQHDDCHRMGG
eukprot:656059-Prymnesium_polylepis.1